MLIKFLPQEANERGKVGAFLGLRFGEWRDISDLCPSVTLKDTSGVVEARQQKRKKINERGISGFEAIAARISKLAIITISFASC